MILFKKILILFLVIFITCGTTEEDVEVTQDLKSNSDQDASADRMTFAAVLEIIAQNSPTNKESPYPCDTLR